MNANHYSGNSGLDAMLRETKLALPELIEPLRAMRMVHYMAWLSERWQDPAFPQAFPWFAEDKYWEGQILALKEQMSALQEAPIRL